MVVFQCFASATE